MNCWISDKAHQRKLSVCLLMPILLVSFTCSDFRYLSPGEESMLFFVGSGKGDSEPILKSGIKVFLIAKSGKEIALGKTDSAGSFELSKKWLQANGSVLLFCRTEAYCPGFRLKEENFFQYDERYVKLPPRGAELVPLKLGTSLNVKFAVGFGANEERTAVAPGVETYLITVKGEEVFLGVTDSSGSIEVSRRQLRDAGTVVLFCYQPGFYCTGVRLPAIELSKIDKLYVELAPLALL